MKQLIDFLMITFMILLTTGWFLIPEYFNYVIWTCITIDMLGLLFAKLDNIHKASIVILTIFNLCALHYEWLRYGYLIIGTLSVLGFILLRGFIDEVKEADKIKSEEIVPIEKVKEVVKDTASKLGVRNMELSQEPNETLIEKFVKFNNKIIISEYETPNKLVHYHIELADDEEETKKNFIELINQSLEWIHLRQKNEKKSGPLDFIVTLCQPFDFDKLNKLWEEPKEEVKESK